MPTPTSFSVAVTTTETTLGNPITTQYHSCKISNLDVMVSGDIYVFRMYSYDETSTTYKLELTETRSGVQTETVLRFNAIADTHFKVTAQKISGTDHTFNGTTWL